MVQVVAVNSDRSADSVLEPFGYSVDAWSMLLSWRERPALKLSTQRPGIKLQAG